MADPKPVDLGSSIPAWGWLLIFALAAYGLVTLENRIWPCRVSDGCDPNEQYDAADAQW